MPSEVLVRRIPLTGPAAERDVEFSGLAWFGDHLLLMPQYPDRFPLERSDPDEQSENGALFAIPRATLQAAIDGANDQPIEPAQVEVIAPHLYQRIPGMQGFEAIAVSGNRMFATIEAGLEDRMSGWLLSGDIAPDLRSVRFDTEHMVEIRPSAPIDNASQETLLIIDNRVLTLFEANGKNVNPAPIAHVFDFALRPLGTIPFPSIEYRIIDATRPDERGRFWVSNTFYTGDREIYRPAADPIARHYGRGPTHRASEIVERLLLLEYRRDRITRVDHPPVQLHLESETRNWEGLVRFGDQGFLVATDMFPETILGFVPAPAP